MESLAAKYLAPLGLTTEGDYIRASAYMMIAQGLAAFVALLFVQAPYGKHNGNSLTGYFGPMVPGKLAWVLQELPALLVPAALWYAAANGIAPFSSPLGDSLRIITPNTVLLGIYLFHYVNRAVIFPLRLRGGKPTPLGVMLMAFTFCVWNGWQQGRYLTAFAQYPSDYLTSPRFVLGVLLFFVGMAINWHSDGVLINLRKPGETGYKIPRGGMFEYVSGANFFGEILEWTGFAVAANSLPATAFAMFTFCNIAPRGAGHHAWYKRQLKDYPLSRKAVIPFVW